MLTPDSTTSSDVQESHIALIRDLIKSKERQAEKYEKLKRSLTNPDNREFKASPHLNLMLDGTSPRCNESKPILPVVESHTEQQRSLGNFDQQEETSLAFAHHLFSLFDRLIMDVDTPAYRIGLLSRYRIRNHIYNARSREIDQLKYLYGWEARWEIHAIIHAELAVHSVALAHHDNTAIGQKLPSERSQKPNDKQFDREKMLRAHSISSQAAYPNDRASVLRQQSLSKRYCDPFPTLLDTHAQDNPYDRARFYGQPKHAYPATNSPTATPDIWATSHTQMGKSEKDNTIAKRIEVPAQQYKGQVHSVKCEEDSSVQQVARRDPSLPPELEATLPPSSTYIDPKQPEADIDHSKSVRHELDFVLSDDSSNSDDEMFKKIPKPSRSEVDLSTLIRYQQYDSEDDDSRVLNSDSSTSHPNPSAAGNLDDSHADVNTYFDPDNTQISCCKYIHENHVLYRCAAPGCNKRDKFWPGSVIFSQHCARLHRDLDPEELVRKSRFDVSCGAEDHGSDSNVIERQKRNPSITAHIDNMIKALCSGPEVLERRIPGDEIQRTLEDLMVLWTPIVTV